MLIIQELKTMRNFNQYITFLPCDDVRHFEDDTNTELTKTFQAVVTTQHPYRKLLVNKA